MKSKDFKIYREGHLEGYEIGLRDGAYIEKILKIFFIWFYSWVNKWYGNTYANFNNM
jgi:hypothetical protein